MKQLNDHPQMQRNSIKFIIYKAFHTLNYYAWNINCHLGCVQLISAIKNERNKIYTLKNCINDWINCMHKKDATLTICLFKLSVCCDLVSIESKMSKICKSEVILRTTIYSATFNGWMKFFRRKKMTWQENTSIENWNFNSTIEAKCWKGIDIHAIYSAAFFRHFPI